MAHFFHWVMCLACGSTTKISLGGGGLLLGSTASHLKTEFDIKLLRITEQLNGFLFILTNF